MNWTLYENYASGLDDASERVCGKWQNQYLNVVERKAWGDRINYELNLKPPKYRPHPL